MKVAMSGDDMACMSETGRSYLHYALPFSVPHFRSLLRWSLLLYSNVISRRIFLCSSVRIATLFPYFMSCPSSCLMLLAIGVTT